METPSETVTIEFPVKEVGGSIGVLFSKSDRDRLDIQEGDVLVAYKLKDKGSPDQLWLKVEKKR